MHLYYKRISQLAHFSPCSCLKHGEKCLGCSCHSDKFETKVTATQFYDIVHVLQDEQMQTIEDAGGETMTNVYNYQDEIEGEAAQLLDIITNNGGVEFGSNAGDQMDD